MGEKDKSSYCCIPQDRSEHHDLFLDVLAARCYQCLEAHRAELVVRAQPWPADRQRRLLPSPLTKVYVSA